jgi:signal transduction histidine kinase/ActR/RegA family two-component response regulator
LTTTDQKSQSFETGIDTFLARTAERELVRRSPPGALLYFVAFLLTVFTTPYQREHPIFVLLAGLLILALGALRLLSALRLRDAPNELLVKWIRPFHLLIYVQFAVWGLFCAVTLSIYGLIPAAFMMLLYTVGLASGATTSLASDYILGRRALFLMIAPSIAPAIAMQTPLGDVLAIVVALFTVYLMMQIKQHWASGREANKAAALRAMHETEERLGQITANEERAAAEKRQRMTEVLLALWRTTAVHHGELEESLREIAKVASETLMVERVNIWQPTEDGKKLRCLVLYEQSLARFSSGMELEIAAFPSYFHHLDAHRTIASDDARTDSRTKELLENYIEPLKITSMMDSSIRLEDGQLGVICHEHIGMLRHWSPEDQAFAASLADLVAMTIMRSRRAEAEQQRRQTQKLEALGVLAGGIAHDFNNILAAINGFAELALRDISRESPARSRLEHILRAGGRAADLVRQILAFSSRGERQKDIVNVRNVVGEVMTLLRASIPASIEIVSNVKHDEHVLASVIEVQQILINLCTNSYHAMKDGGRIEITSDVIDLPGTGLQRDIDLAAGRYISISVSDTGPGIDPKMRERIFDPFFTTKPVGHGTGLGLAVVHGIVRYHRGAVDVISTPGQGACFNVYLPLCEVKTLDRPEPEISVAAGNEHILFVDDEEILVQLWKEVLEHNGYTVTCARNGEEALDLFQSNPYTYDLVLTDVTMPKMSGPDLVKGVFELRPGMPIIMTTGYTDTMIVSNLRGLGIHDTLLKPCPSRVLLGAVRDALDHVPIAANRQSTVSG